MLSGVRFAAPIPLGAPGDWLVLANRYDGPDHDVVVMMNTGASAPVMLNSGMPAETKTYDCWGNPLPKISAGGTLRVGMYPTYIIVPHGAPFAVSLPALGANIATSAQIQISDPKGQAGAAKLTNGLLEFDFHDETEREGMYATEGVLPVDITLTWPSAHDLDSAIVYGNLADNGYCTPLDYDVQLRVNGEWRTVDQVRTPTGDQILRFSAIPRITSYANPWVFDHRFAPTRADGIRFHFIRTTCGQYATAEMLDDLTAAYGWSSPPKPTLQLREIQVYEAAR
jgi:hypothetical protein